MTTPPCSLGCCCVITRSSLHPHDTPNCWYGRSMIVPVTCAVSMRREGSAGRSFFAAVASPFANNLGDDQLRIDASPSEELRVAPLLGDDPVVEHDDCVGVANRR